MADESVRMQSLPVPRRREDLGDMLTTMWTEIRDWVHMEEATRRRILDEFSRRYDDPLLAYFKALVRDIHMAEDLAQAFFEERVLTGRIFDHADRTRGKFRFYLKAAAHNFYVDWRRGTVKDPVATGIPIDAEGVPELPDRGDGSQPDREYVVACARSLLAIALEKVRVTCKARNQQDHYELFVRRYLPVSGDAPSWAELGSRFGLDEKAARGRAETVARHFRIVFRELLMTEVDSQQAVDEDIAVLRAALSGVKP